MSQTSSFGVTATTYVDSFAGAAAVLEEPGHIDPCPIGTVAREVANTSEPLRIAAATVFDSWISATTRHLTSAGIAISAIRSRPIGS